MRNLNFTWKRLSVSGFGFIVMITGIFLYINKPWVSSTVIQGWYTRNADFPVLFAHSAAPAEKIHLLEPEPNNQSSVKQGSPKKVDINKATLAELDALPGIGPAKARAILDYREQIGFFRSTEELLKVKGIGIKIYESIKEITTVAL